MFGLLVCLPQADEYGVVETLVYSKFDVYICTIHTWHPGTE